VFADLCSGAPPWDHLYIGPPAKPAVGLL